MASSVEGARLHSSCTASSFGIAGKMGEDLISPSFPGLTINTLPCSTRPVCAVLLYLAVALISSQQQMPLFTVAEKCLEMSLWAALNEQEAHQLGVSSQGVVPKLDDLISTKRQPQSLGHQK